MILRDERAGTEHRVAEGGARLGRDPSLEIVFPPSEDVVSAAHCRVLQRDGSWWLEDLASTNGTWLEGLRIAVPTRITTGQRFSLGQRGPVMRVTIPGQSPKTRAEPALDLAGPLLRLRRVKGGEDLVAGGPEIVIGRASACNIPLRTVVDTVVSKRHAVVGIDEHGGATILDLGSRNGTFLNNKPVRARTPLHLGDRVMFGWDGPLFEVRAVGGAIMPEGEGAPYQPKREPPKTLSGMVAVAEDKARGATGVKPGIFVRTMARQMATESSLAFRVTVLGLFVVLVVVSLFAYRSMAQRTADTQAQLASTQRALSDQLREAGEAQRHASAEIEQLRQDLASARASSVSRAVVDSLERRLLDAEAAAAVPTAAPAGAPHDFADVARENGRAVGLVIVRFATDSIMGTGFAITRSGYFVTNRHVVQDEARGGLRQVTVVMSETNVPLEADVASISSIQSQDVAVLKVRAYHGPVVRAVDWAGRGAQQGMPAVMLGFPFGTQLATDLPGGAIKPTLLSGAIAQTGDWIRFSGTNTYVGASGSPLFNVQGEVIGVHFGAPREGPGLGISVPMSKVRRWLPVEARTELGL